MRQLQPCHLHAQVSSLTRRENRRYRDMIRPTVPRTRVDCRCLGSPGSTDNSGVALSNVPDSQTEGQGEHCSKQ